jgi:hypothetical protein
MTDEPAAPAGKLPRSREQLLRMLHDNPASVSRVEIKAAFADGRLGDQDLDIPVLAGMKRITELLSELDPSAAAEPPPSPHGAVTVAGEQVGAREPSRPTSSSVRIGDIETQLGQVADRVAALEVRIQEDRAAATTRAAAADRAGLAMARSVRIIAVVLIVVVVLVVIQLGVRIANG